MLISGQRELLARAARPGKVDDGVAHGQAVQGGQFVENLQRQRAPCRRRIPDFAGLRLLQRFGSGPATRWPKTGEISGAVTKSLPESGRAPNSFHWRNSQARRVQGQFHEAVEGAASRRPRNLPCNARLQGAS